MSNNSFGIIAPSPCTLYHGAKYPTSTIALISSDLLSVPPCQHRTSRIITVPLGAHIVEVFIRWGSAFCNGGCSRVRCVCGIMRIGPFVSWTSVSRVIYHKPRGRHIEKTYCVNWIKDVIFYIFVQELLLCAGSVKIARTTRTNIIYAPKDSVKYWQDGRHIYQLHPRRLIRLIPKSITSIAPICVDKRNLFHLALQQLWTRLFRQTPTP